MKLGIIVYSHTGNTLSVSEKIKKELEVKNLSINIERLEPVNKDDIKPGAQNIEYKKVPDLEYYDGYIFASPVQAFSLCAGMKSYLENIETLKNKKTFYFVTKGLPFNWTGGNRALRQFKKLLKSKSANIVDSGIVKWTKSKDKDIDSLIDKIKRSF